MLLIYNKDPAPWQKITKIQNSAGRVTEGSKYEKQSKMKRFGNLYDKICSIENLQLADVRARRHKEQSYGVLLHDKNRETNILALNKSLVNQSYKTSEYNIFNIYEPKEREIYQLPYYPDRILHHAIMNVMEPIWTSLFTSDTYSCIKGRGIHLVVKKLKRTLKENPDKTIFCLKMDIRKFYPSIDHGILKNILQKKIKDSRLLDLLFEIIDSASGVPIGNYLSQFFANLYLSYLDHYLKEYLKVKYYYRYADDMVILSESKERLHAILEEIKTYLHNNLKLELKGNYQIFPVDARSIDFVGYRFYHSHILLRKSIKQSMCRRAAKLNKLGFITLEDYKRKVSSHVGWAKHCNSRHLLKKIIRSEYYEEIQRA